MKLRIALILSLLVPAAVAPSLAETIEEKAKVCMTCHGENGIPVAPEIPIIFGQHTGYLYIQLKDFKSGLRASEQMGPIASEMTKEEMMAFARYFSEKPWPRTDYTSSEGDAKVGERVNAAGLCTECHLGNFVGTSTIPRTSGQTVTYLEKTLLAFKSRERGNNADKSTLLASYPDEDLKAMARYLAGIHAQP
jgi:cytochrome c553